MSRDVISDVFASVHALKDKHKSMLAETEALHEHVRALKQRLIEIEEEKRASLEAGEQARLHTEIARTEYAAVASQNEDWKRKADAAAAAGKELDTKVQHVDAETQSKRKLSIDAVNHFSASTLAFYAAVTKTESIGTVDSQLKAEQALQSQLAAVRAALAKVNSERESQRQQAQERSATLQAKQAKLQEMRLRCQAAVSEHKRLEAALVEVKANDGKLRETLAELNALTAAMKRTPKLTSTSTGNRKAAAPAPAPGTKRPASVTKDHTNILAALFGDEQDE